MARTSPYAQDCPIARTLDLIGDRWTLLIIRDLFLGRSRFNEFRQSTPRISPKLLSERLKRLEDDGHHRARRCSTAVRRAPSTG